MKPSIEQQVKEKYPNADYVKMGITEFSVHSVFADSTWKELLGQSVISEKLAWQSALYYIKSNQKSNL